MIRDFELDRWQTWAKAGAAFVVGALILGGFGCAALALGVEAATP